MKKFDAVQSVRDIRDAIYDKTKDKSEKDLIFHYQKIAEQAKAVQEKRATYQSNNK